MKTSVLRCILLLCFSLPLAVFAQTSMILPTERWLLVDATNATLSVMRGETVEARFNGISLGRRGPKPVHYAGDHSTPIGEFHVDAVNYNSQYSLFFRLNYPTLAHANLALAEGRLSPADHERIAMAEWQGRPPPHDTPLGGMIGIHGIGQGSLDMHRTFNWTEGCVALDNQQIRALEAYVRVGMRVIIRESGAGLPAPQP